MTAALPSKEELELIRDIALLPIMLENEALSYRETIAYCNTTVADMKISCRFHFK